MVSILRVGSLIYVDATHVPQYFMQVVTVEANGQPVGRPAWSYAFFSPSETVRLPRYITLIPISIHDSLDSSNLSSTLYLSDLAFPCLCNVGFILL